MIVSIDTPVSKTLVGGKAHSLSILKENGFNVPDGFVLTTSAWRDTIAKLDSENKLGNVLAKNSLSSKEKSDQLLEIMATFRLTEAITTQLTALVDPSKTYAVRSSASKEDLATFSFAGQYDTFLEISGIENIAAAILSCYSSLYNETVLQYLENNSLGTDQLEMAVIVQEMVDSQISGVVFTINPTTGADKELLIEVAEGLGDALVSGHVNPHQYRYNWYDDKVISQPEKGLLSHEQLTDLVAEIKRINLLFGYPCDIEFAFVGNELYFLQSRAITKINYSALNDIWTTADFKDGGVSATICTPFMWSLYEYAWEVSFGKFLGETHLLTKEKLRKSGNMFFGRPYWNLSMAKEALSMIPGYKEREFDSDYGIAPTYEGDGATTGFSPVVLAKFVKIAVAQVKLLSNTLKNAESSKIQLLDTYNNYVENFSNITDKQVLETEIKKLIKEDYLKSEDTYFTQIFINTVQQSLFKDTTTKHTDDAGYFALISGLENISHLLPFYFLWDSSREIRSSTQGLEYWQSNSAETILKDFKLNPTSSFLVYLKDFSRKFGYHSEKELDVTFPCYSEDLSSIATELKQLITLDDSYSPELDLKRQHEAYKEQLKSLELSMSKSKFKKLKNKTEKMRNLLWWREEFRDVSTHYYYLIRLYSLKLAEKYEKLGILQDKSDIWFLKIDDLFKFIDKSIDLEALEEIILKNKNYYYSYHNYQSENEIGAAHRPMSKTQGENIAGIGANLGVVTGTARVIENLADTSRLEKGDILVTRFTDTGWTSKFVLLSGIVTEYGGVLCHAAIVSREYGIPCIVCTENAVSRIKDGSTITLNGATGEITLRKER